MFSDRNKKDALEASIASLSLLRRAVCCYVNSDNMCDCKYGYKGEKHGERTGCPELRDMITHLENMQELERESLGL